MEQHEIAEGMKVRVADDATYCNASYSVGESLCGLTGTVVSRDGTLVDDQGDVRVKFENGVVEWIGHASLSRVEEDSIAEDEGQSPEPARSARTLGTATVKVDVRFFVGDLDVTEKVKGLLA